MLALHEHTDVCTPSEQNQLPYLANAALIINAYCEVLIFHVFFNIKIKICDKVAKQVKWFKKIVFFCLPKNCTKQP